MYLIIAAFYSQLNLPNTSLVIYNMEYCVFGLCQLTSDKGKFKFSAQALGKVGLTTQSYDAPHRQQAPIS